MIPRDQHRRSPERERRRRADRRQSREQLAAATLAAAAVGHTAAADPSSSNRSRANSSTSSSAVTSSDEDSAPKNTGWGFRSFFSLASSKKVRKRRSFRKKNYSSSSVDSNLAYGGYQSRSSLESQRGVRRRSGPQRKISQTYSQHDKEYQQHKDQPKDQYNDHHYEPQHEYQRPEYVPQDQYAHSDQHTPRPYVPDDQSNQTTPRPQHPQQPHVHPEPYYRHQHQQYHQQQPHGYHHPSQYHHDQPEYDPELFTPDGRPNLARTKTDEEIIELGRKISDLARASNLRDLERAGKQRPSQLVGAATAISNFRRQNARRNGRRGLAPSKSKKRNEQNDHDQGWDTASDSDSDSGDNTEEASASDSDLAYGSSPHYSDDKLSSPPAAAPPPPAISPQKPYVRNKAVDPSKFGPVNSLNGFVTPLNSFRPTESAPPPRQSKPWLNRFENDPLPEHPTPADELDTPMQMVYPVATPDPHRFDAVTSPTLVSGSPLITSRPVAVAIQAPKPRVPVSTRALEEHQMPRQRSADGRHLVADSALAKSVGTAADKHEVIQDDTPPSNYRQHRSRASDMSTGSAHPSQASHHSHTSHTSHVPVHVQVPLPTTRDLEFDDWHDFEDRHNRLASDVPKFTDPAAAGVAATLIGTALFQDRHRRDDEEERSLDPNHVLAEYKARVQQEEEQRRKAEEAEKERLEKERQEREARAAAAIKREREAREAQEAAEREAREKQEAEERAAAAALELAAQREREEREAREALEKMQKEAEERAAAAAAAQRELEALEKARREAQERQVQEAIEKARREALERAAAAEERERQEREHLEKVRREAEDLAIAARRELETRESAIEAVAKEARRLRDEADYREQYERRVREAREMQYKEERRMHDARYRAERDNMVVDVEPRHRSTSRQPRDESPEGKRSSTAKETDREEHHRSKPQAAVTIINERDAPKDEPKPKVEEPTRSVPEKKKRESMGDTLNPKPNKPSKEERRAKRAETLRLLAEMQKELELEKERARKLAELEAAEQQQQEKPKDEEPRKSSSPVVPESSEPPKDQVSPDSKEAPAPGPSPSKSPSGVIDPFQFQVPDDAFATPVYATPARPLTPQVYTVPEPDILPPMRHKVIRQLTDQELEIRERVTRRDSFEIEKRQEEIRRSRNASEQPTGDYFDPKTHSEADRNTPTLEEPERERSRSRNRAGSRVRESEPLRDITEEPGRARSRSRQPSHVREAEPKPDPQAEANKWYRDYINSQRKERLGSSSPNRSVVDKYDGSKSEPSSPVIVTAEPTIITAEPKWDTVEPTDDGKPRKSKYAEPNADVKIDHVILPRDLHRFLTPAEHHSSLHAPAGQPMFSSRDPSCERERPLLTLVLPTPAPTPNPERQRRVRERQAARESETGPVAAKPTSEEPKPAPAVAEGPKKPNYRLNARGEIEIMAPTPTDEDNESVKSDGWVEPVADTGLTHVVADRSRQAAVEAIKRALLQPKKERKASSAWGALGGALLKKVADDRKAAAENETPEVEEKVDVPASVVETPIIEEKQSEEQESRELEPETKPGEVAAPTKDQLPRQAPHPPPEPHPEPHHDTAPVPAITIQEPESPKATEYEEPKEEPKEEQSALPEKESHEEKEDEATRQIVHEPTSSPVRPKGKLPKGLVEPSIFSPYRPTFSDNFADVVCGENPNPDTHADTYTWRRDGVAAEPDTQTSDEWESLPRKAEIDEDETTTNPKRTFNPDNREPPDRLGKEFSFEVVEREDSQTYPSDETAREGEKVSTEHNGVSNRRPSHEFIDFLKNQTNGSTSDGKQDHIISTTELSGNNEEQSFLGNAGTHGAGAGSAEDSEAATASESKEAEAQILPRPNATQASMDSIPVAKTPHSGSNAGSDSAPEPAQQLRHTDSRFIDPEVLVQRPITPAIDPQYGDLLPLPPYPTLMGPGYRYLADLLSPLDFDLEHLPALPESRPSTPPPMSGSGSSRSSSFKAAVTAMMGTQSMIRSRQRGHTRSRSALDGTTAAVRVPSQTAVPIQFRLKGGKRSGSAHSIPPREAWGQGQSPVSRPSSAHGDAFGGTTFPVRSKPRPSSWESSMREMKPLYLVERTNAATATAVSVSAPVPVEVVDTDEALPLPESFELPDDDDLDLLPALPESAPESDAESSPIINPVKNLSKDLPVDEVLKQVQVPSLAPAETERALPALGPETVKLPVDEDLDLLPALPESPITEAAVPVAALPVSSAVPEVPEEAFDLPKVSKAVEVEDEVPAAVSVPTEQALRASAPEEVTLPVDEDLDLLPSLPESPITETAVPVPLPAVTPETVKLPVDEDLDLLPALPQSPTTEAAVPVSLPAVMPEVVEEAPKATEASEAVEVPKTIQIPAPVERDLQVLPSPQTVKLPVDEDLDLLPALPESGPASPTLREPASPVFVGEDEAFATPAEEAVPVPEAVKLPEDVRLPLPVDEDLDLLPALPDSPAVETTPSLPVPAPQVGQISRAIEIPQTIEVPVTVAPDPEAVELPVDEDLDLLPALPDSLATSPTTETITSVPVLSREVEVAEETPKAAIEREVLVPENIKLPVDEDLDLLPALPDSIATSPTAATMPSLPVLASEVAKAPKTIQVAPETITLPADEDLDILPALPASGNTSPERSPSPVLEKAGSPVIVPVSKPEPETVELPVDQDLDFLPALPESGPASPTKEYASLATSPVVSPATEKEIDNEAEPVSEVSRELEEMPKEAMPEPELQPEAVSLPADDDLDLLPALPESEPASPTKEYASLATSPVASPALLKETEPEAVSLPVDEDLDLLPALPEGGPASPALEHVSRPASPVAAVFEKEPAPEATSEAVREAIPEPENVALPKDQDLDLLPALPESSPASPTREHASLATSPVVEAVIEKEPIVEVVHEVVPELLPLPVDQDLDLLPALPESIPASPTKEHASLATSPVMEAVNEPVDESISQVEVVPELLPLPKDQDLDLLPALPESAPASPTKEFAFPVSCPAEIPRAAPEVVSEDISNALPVEIVPELLPLPKDQDLDLLPALPESGPSSPVSREFATPVAQPKDISADEQVKQPSKDSEDVLTITIPEPDSVPLPAESDDGLWALPSLPQSRASSGYASPVTATIPIEEISSPVKAIEETSELPISFNPETIRLPSDDGLWALPSLPGSREGSGYASPVAAMPSLGVEPPMRDLEEYFPIDHSDQEAAEEISSKVPVEEVETELPLHSLPQLPADEDLDLLPALPESRSESPEIVQPSTPKVEEAVSEPIEKAIESTLSEPELVSLPVDEDLDLLPQLPESRSDSPTAQPSTSHMEEAVVEEVKKVVDGPALERNLPESVSLPVDEDLDLLPQLPESRSSSPGYELLLVAPETKETTEKAVGQIEQLPALPTDEDLDLLPQLPESRSSSPGYELPAAIPELEQEQTTIDHVAKDFVHAQEPATPVLSSLPSLPIDEDLDLRPELPASRGSSLDLAVSLPLEDQEVSQAEEIPKQLDLSELPALPVDQDLELLPELPESRNENESPEPAVSLPVTVPEEADFSKLPALPVDEDLDILPALPESRNDSPEPQPSSLSKAISPEVLPLPADEDLDLLPELPESRASTPDQEASLLPVAAPKSPLIEKVIKDVIEVPVLPEQDLSRLPALPADEDLDILPALPDSPAVDNFPEEETQTSQLLEELFTQPAWEETQPTQLSDIVDEDYAVPAVNVDEVSKDLSDLPALPESRSGTPLSDLPALPESRSSSRSEDMETAPSLEDPLELPPLPESREDSPEPKSPLPVLGAQPATESLAKQIAPGQPWNEGETQDEPIPTSNDITVAHVRRDSSEAAHPGDIYEKPSSHNQAKSPVLVGNNDPNEIDYKLAETIYEDMCEDDASTVAASDAPSFLSGANAEQKEQIAKALAGDSEATSSLSPESSFRVLQYLKKRDAAMKQGQTYEEPEEVVPGPSSQYEDEEEQVSQEIEEALEVVEEVQFTKKAKGVSFVSLEDSESEPTPPATEKPNDLEDAATDEDMTSDQSTPRQELRIGIPGPSSRVANLEAVNNELEKNIPDSEAQEEEEEEPFKTWTNYEDKHTESESVANQEKSSGEPQPGSILGGGLVAEPERERERQHQRQPMRVSSPDDQWGTLGDLDGLDDENDDDDVSEYSPGGTNMKRYSLTRLPTFPGVTAFLGRNFRTNSEPNPHHPSDVPVQDERDYYSSDEQEMLGEELTLEKRLDGDELEKRLEGVKVDEEGDAKIGGEEKSGEVEGADESQTVPEPEKSAESQPESAQEAVPTEEPESTEKKALEVEEPKEPEPEAKPETEEAVEPEAVPATKSKKNGPGLDRHSTWPAVKSDAVSSERKTAPESESTGEEAPAPKESTDNTTTLPEETPLPKSGDLSPTDDGLQPPTRTTDAALPEAIGLDTNPQIQDSLDSAESRHLPSESLTPLPDRQDTTEPTETASQDEDTTATTIATEREPETETIPMAKQDEATTTADEKQTATNGLDENGSTEDKDKPQEESATAPPDLASPTSETFTPRLLRRSTAKKEKIKAGKMSNPASPTMGAGWGIASPPALNLDKALEAADPFAAGDLEKRMRTVSENREAERSAKIAEKEKLERALFLQRRSTFDNVGNSPTSSHNSVLGSSSSVVTAADAGGSVAESERPTYALKRASTDRAEKKKMMKLAAEQQKKKNKKSDWPDAWPEEFDEEATMPQEPGHPSMWPELHGRTSPSPIRGRSGYRTPTPLGQYIEETSTTDTGPKDMPPPEPIPEVPSKPIPNVGSDTATPSSETNKELGSTLKASGKKGRRRRSSSLAVATDKEEDVDANNSEAEQGDLDTQPSSSAPGNKSKKTKRGRKGKGKATDSPPAANAEDAEGQEASDGDEEPSSGNAQDANAGAAGDASGRKKRKKNKRKGSQASSGLMSPPLEPNPEVAQLTAQLAQLTDLVQQLVVEKTRSPSVDPATQGRSRRSSSVTKGNPKIRRTSSGGGGDGDALYDSDGFSIADEDEELDDDDNNNETAAADETTKAKRFMGVPYRRGSKSKSDKGGEKGDKAKDKHQQQLTTNALHFKSSSQSTTSPSTRMNLGIPKLGLNSLLGGKSSSSGPKEMSTQTSSPEPSPRNSFSKDDGDEEVAGAENRRLDSNKYPPSASKPVKSKVRRAMSGLSRTRGAPSLEQIPETEFEDSELEDGAASPGPKPGMLNRAMTGMSLDKLDFRKPRSSSVGGEQTDRRPATAADAESINLETASITQPKASAMMKRAFSGMIPTTSKPRASLDQSETESISGARPSMMKRAMTGMIPGAAKPRSSMDSTTEHSGERKMSMGSAFKNFSMGREPSRTREPSSRGPSIDLGPRETDSTEISPHESPALRPQVLPDPNPQPKPGMMKRALTGLNPAASRPDMADRRESEPVLEKEKHKTLDRLTFGMMSKSHSTSAGVGTQTPDSGFNSTQEQDLLEPSRPGSGSGSGSSSIHHHQQQQSSEKSKTNKTMKMLGLGAFTKKDKNPELVETPAETSRPGSSGSHQTTTAVKPSRLDRTISGMNLTRPRKSISQENSPLDADSRPGTGSSMQPPLQPQFAVRPDPSPAPKSRMASFNKVMTLGLIKDKSDKTPAPSHHEPETATQTPMESSASAHSNGSRPTSWNSNQFPENPVLEGKPSKPQTRMGRAMSALSIPTSRNSASQERPASSYPETTTSTNLTEPTDVTDSHSHHSHQSNQTTMTVTDKKEKSKMSFKSVVTLGMASSNRSSSSRRQSVDHSSQTQTPQMPAVQQAPAMPKLELPSFGLGDSLLGSPPGTSAGLGGTLSPPGTSSGLTPPPPAGSISAPATSYGFPNVETRSESMMERQAQKDAETASMMNQPKPGMLSRTKTAMSIGSRKDGNDSAEASGEKKEKKVMSTSAKANWNRALKGTKGMGGMFGKKKDKEKDKGV
ncbi:hypothetical protein QBC32DRAFT_378687, partial [Pseudoneurospora amorphoporcata]